ncbi:hypothetical protein HU200_046660 [Digitaria exilis]|uniref:Uncharacterized protein n=1 Tax=Digitaria exilis TaxID=1010633 RepID=A0A835B0U3_9POAL|nr:hypothetical protein HU200_046660 [Digitaria exilis]
MSFQGHETIYIFSWNFIFHGNHCPHGLMHLDNKTQRLDFNNIDPTADSCKRKFISEFPSSPTS